MVGGLPIAIAHMAGYMFTSKTNPKELQQMLETGELYDIWSKSKTWTTPQYEQTLDMVWHIALQELSTSARELLYVISMLNPDGIPDELLVEWSSSNSDPNLQKSEKPRNLDEIRTGLLKRQLVDRGEFLSGERYLTIHRSLQINLRTSLVDDYPRRQKIFDKAVALIRNVFPSQSKIMTPVNHHWDTYEKYQPHLMSLQTIFSQAEGGLKGTSVFASLLSDEANYFWERNFLNDGVRASKLAVSILNNMDEPDHNAQAQALCLQGDIELEKGFSGRRTGLDVLLTTLDIRKRYINKPPPGGTPDEQLLYANAWNDFGCGLLEFAEYAKAEKYLDHALEIKKRITNKHDEPMEFAEAYMNLAMVRCFQSRYDEAKTLLEESVKLAEKANGRHSACAQNFTFYWATVLLNSKDLEAAREKHEDILEERKDIFGTFSLRTRHSYYALGTTYQELGRLDDSEKMFRDSLESLDRFPCPDEYIARSQYSLAQVLKLKNNRNHEEATELEARARKLRDRLLDQYAPDFDWGDMDELGVFDYMVSYKAGRTTMGQAPVKLFDVFETGIDQSIAAFGKHDSRLRNPGSRNES
ncbi:MAG: hypothetical protein ALECFALPRED_004841 [Alectoria fallacina]|uniref:DUF7779 domain-containing protein n=1 Tax=Alectoria fallacina TaxID=1903189 RepID=A0A8H3EGC0_9LECA|nr:MAG: hypothetical protein ALECFALPRED_004841 [Alectoria fallacina]